MIKVFRLPSHLRLTQISAQLSFSYHHLARAQPRRQMATRSYSEAVEQLNSLQSNAATIEALRAAGGRLNDLAIPEMVEYLERIGYSVSSLCQIARH